MYTGMNLPNNFANVKLCIKAGNNENNSWLQKIFDNIVIHSYFFKVCMTMIWLVHIYFLKIFLNFLTSTLLCAHNMTLLSKVRWRFFSNFVTFSENPNFNHRLRYCLHGWTHSSKKNLNFWIIFLNWLLCAPICQAQIRRC